MQSVVSVLFLLLAFFDFGLCTATCGPAVASCAKLPVASGKACSSIIASSKLKIATCEKPRSTIVKTVTVTPKLATRSITVKSTLSKPTTIRRTSLSIETDYTTESLFSTETQFSTFTDVSTATEYATITVPETTTSTATTVSTSTSTLTTTWFEEDHCDAAPVKRDGLFRRNKNPLPKDCSCYLTTSKSCNSQPTTIYKTVTKLPATTTKSVTIIATVNKVITQSTIQRSTTLIQETTLIDATTIVPVSTLSSTTETSTETATSTATEVTTVTESASATATAYVDRCAPGNIEQLSGIPSFLNGVVVQLGMTSDYQGDYYCCQDCFNNADCVYWAKSSQACYGYYTSRTGPEDDCKVAGQCTRGVQQWEDTTNQGGMTYYKGKCMREAPGPA